jgi:hypothetical protein
MVERYDLDDADYKDLLDEMLIGMADTIEDDPLDDDEDDEDYDLDEDDLDDLIAEMEAVMEFDEDLDAS